jgi:hypothetical protein
VIVSRHGSEAVAKELSMTYTFGRSLIDERDVASLRKNQMVGSGKAPGQEDMPKSHKN